MKPEIGRRLLFKLSLFSAASVFLGKVFFFKKTNPEDHVISYYKIKVPIQSTLQQQIQGIPETNQLNVFSALSLKSFDENWVTSYDSAKYSATVSSELIKSEKIYSDRSHTLYIKSTWSSVESYISFLEKANMKSFHNELKLCGYEPELKVFSKNVQLNTFQDYV